MTKNDALLPCQKETALENIESSMNLYDMPEHQDTLAVEGWALSELVDEVKRWRSTHSAGEFSPDYCAAREALAEHLEHCTRPTPAPLSKGDAIEDDGGFRKAIEEWVKKQRNALTYHPDLDSGLDELKIRERSGGYAAYKNTLDFIKAYNLTPSPVAVDAKAGDAPSALKRIEKILQLDLPDERSVWEDFRIVSNALTAPKPDSKE